MCSKRQGKGWIWVLAGLVSLAAAGAAFHVAMRIPPAPLPDGVRRYECRLVLAGRRVTADVYSSARVPRAPVVILAHGFLRNRKTMAGWAGMLAGEGFIAVAPDLPSLADHPRNARAISELVQRIEGGGLPGPAKPDGRLALAGFSAGGFSTLLAASGSPGVSCWVGLDPVGIEPAAGKAAASLEIPAFILRTEPSPSNAEGNARNIFAAVRGPAFSLVVNNACHVDAENPTSRAAEWACGRSDARRRATFGRYLVASLRSAVMNDPEAALVLAAAAQDHAVREVSSRNSSRAEPRRAP